MSDLTAPPPDPKRRRLVPGPIAAGLRSERTRRGNRTRRLAQLLTRAQAGDRDAGIRYALDSLGVQGKLRERCEFLFAIGAHLNGIEDGPAVLHAAQLAMQAEAHMTALDHQAAGGGKVSEWQSKQASYCSQAALRALATLGLTPATRAGGSRRPDRGKRAAQDARAAAAAPDALAAYRRPGVG